MVRFALESWRIKIERIYEGLLNVCNYSSVMLTSDLKLGASQFRDIKSKLCCSWKTALNFHRYCRGNMHWHNNNSSKLFIELVKSMNNTPFHI